MKTCPNTKCNATGIPDDAKFCPKCGYAFQDSNENFDFSEVEQKKQKWEKFLYGLYGCCCIIMIICLIMEKCS